MKKIVLSLVLIFSLSYSINAQLTIDSTKVVNTCLDCDSVGIVPLPNSYGSLYIAVSGGVSPYSYSLTGLHSANTTPLNTTSISGATSFYNSLCQDTFSLLISDFNGASITYNFTTVPPLSPTLSIDSVSVQADSTNNPDSGVIELHVTTNADSVFYLIQDMTNMLNLGSNGGWQDSTVFDSLPGGYYYKVFVDIYPKIIPSCGNGIDTGTSVFQIYVPLACENDGFVYINVYPECVGNPVFYTEFSNLGSGVNNTITQWDWDFGDGTFGGGPTGIHTYPQAGNYMVQLQITTSHGCMFFAAYPVDIYPLPTSAFTYSYNGGGQYTFSDQSTIISGTVNSWLWDFGDGNTSTLQNPVYQYTIPGNYTACLTSYSDFGCEDVFCQNIDFTTGINQIESLKNEIVIFPNPTKDYISILNIDFDEIKILDLTGKVIKSFDGSNRKKYVGDLPEGLYFIKVKNDAGEIGMKFIKE